MLSNKYMPPHLRNKPVVREPVQTNNVVNSKNDFPELVSGATSYKPITKKSYLKISEGSNNPEPVKNEVKVDIDEEFSKIKDDWYFGVQMSNGFYKTSGFTEAQKKHFVEFEKEHRKVYEPYNCTAEDYEESSTSYYTEESSSEYDSDDYFERAEEQEDIEHIPRDQLEKYVSKVNRISKNIKTTNLNSPKYMKYLDMLNRKNEILNYI